VKPIHVYETEQGGKRRVRYLTTCRSRRRREFAAFAREPEKLALLVSRNVRSNWGREARDARVIGRIFALCRAACAFGELGAGNGTAR